jgi:hypothetical protein
MATTRNSRHGARSRHSRETARRSSLPLHLIGLIVLLGMGLVAGGVVVGSHLTSGSSSVARDTAPPPKPPAVVPSPALQAPAPTDSAQPDGGQFAAEFATLADELNVQAGLVVSAVGDGPVLAPVGEWVSGPAWSTIKVPLAIAGLRAMEHPAITEEMRAAITQSDNTAAESIWQSLGDPAMAARKVEEVLRPTGDPTIVESERVRPEFTAFGQTQWSLSDQATFLSSAACDARNAPIISLMDEIAPDQRWGLGTIEGAQFKGGWGPSLGGAYLVRQIGVIPARNGSTVVAVAVQPASGALSDGTQALTRIANWLKEHVDVLPAGHCS